MVIDLNNFIVLRGLVLLLITYYFMHILIIMNTIDYNDLGDLLLTKNSVGWNMIKNKQRR